MIPRKTYMLRHHKGLPRIILAQELGIHAWGIFRGRRWNRNGYRFSGRIYPSI